MKIRYGELKKLVGNALLGESKHFFTVQRLLEQGEDEEEAGTEDAGEEEAPKPEPELPETGDKELEQNDSIDAQVDRYLSDYESEARSSKNEGLDFRAMTVRFLCEAEGDEAPRKELGSDSLDVESFTNSVVRLIDNYDSLLEVRDAIVKRSINFLTKSYTPDVVKQFKDTLLDQYDIEIGKSEEEVDAEQYPAPPADRAGGPGVAGGGGGAGGV